MGLLSELQTLSASGTNISSLPSEIGLCTKLIHVFLDNNKLTTLPNEFSQLTLLQELRLHCNQLETLPDLSALTLARLSIHTNRLIGVPFPFGNAPSGYCRAQGDYSGTDSCSVGGSNCFSNLVSCVRLICVCSNCSRCQAMSEHLLCQQCALCCCYSCADTVAFPGADASADASTDAGSDAATYTTAVTATDTATNTTANTAANTTVNTATYTAANTTNSDPNVIDDHVCANACARADTGRIHICTESVGNELPGASFLTPTIIFPFSLYIHTERLQYTVLSVQQQ